MASNRKSGALSSAQRDPITGEPLQRGTLKMRTSQRTPGHQQDVPMRLHVRAEERVRYEDGPVGNVSERLGCNELAPAFVRFVDEGLRIQKRAERAWWDMPYVLDRLAVHAQSHGATFTLDEMNIALSWYRGQDLVDAGKTHYWIERACRRVQRYVTANFMPREPRERAA
jgi:hypothetical protein